MAKGEAKQVTGAASASSPKGAAAPARKPRRSVFGRVVRLVLFLGAVLFVMVGLAGAGAVLYAWQYFSRGLPDYRVLANYEPPITTRLYAADGRLMAEYAAERRVFVPINAMPKLIIRAFLAAEDKNFYVHPGIDFVAVIRAVVQNLQNMGSGRRPIGASTITQQVAKNFLLSNEVSLERKAKEFILAYRIERAFSKDRILELYLNQIFLGYGSYGVAAAALNYFNKSLDELTVAEAAYLAGLPKGPNNYHPVRFADAARDRRDYVVDRMVEERYIALDQAAEAKAQPVRVRKRDDTELVRADWFAEDVRRELLARYGERETYEGGLAVRTTLDPKLQQIAERVMREGLRRFDRSKGWRGPVARIDGLNDWAAKLSGVGVPYGLDDWKLAVVLAVDAQRARIGFANGSTGILPFEEMRWAAPAREHGYVGAAPRRVQDVVAPGHVVMVEPTATKETFALRQVPLVQGGLVAMDPHTGRVLAMVGGYSTGGNVSTFNRASQAARQPGSAFKPFVYLAALDNGYTPATLILDAPFVKDQGPGKPQWRPENYTQQYYGPSTMRMGIEKSRNLMTVRLADTIGIDLVAQYAERFGVVEKLPRYLPVALGAGETTVLRLTTGYAQIVNGGKKVQPTLIDRIQDRTGRTIYRHDRRNCRGCRPGFLRDDSPMPQLDDVREQIIDAGVAYQMTSILEGVVERGTGQAAVKPLGRPLAGKTGTTNDSNDNWFVGFSPDLCVGLYIGYDQPHSLGEKETGGKNAAPIFAAFMKEALKDQPAVPFRIPPGIRLVAINGTTGERAGSGERGTILEAFKPGTEPVGRPQYIGGDVTGFGALSEGEGGSWYVGPAPAGTQEAGTTPYGVPPQGGQFNPYAQPVYPPGTYPPGTYPPGTYPPQGYPAPGAPPATAYPPVVQQAPAQAQGMQPLWAPPGGGGAAQAPRPPVVVQPRPTAPGPGTGGIY